MKQPCAFVGVPALRYGFAAAIQMPLDIASSTYYEAATYILISKRRNVLASIALFAATNVCRKRGDMLSTFLALTVSAAIIVTSLSL